MDCTLVVPLKDRKGVNESKRTSKKIWVDEGSEFYNRSMKSWSQDNDIEMYSTHSEEKSAVAQKSIRIVNNKIYKYYQKMCILIN